MYVVCLLCACCVNVVLCVFIVRMRCEHVACFLSLRVADVVFYVLCARRV